MINRLNGIIDDWIFYYILNYFMTINILNIFAIIIMILIL